jgi:Dynamin family
MTDPLTSSIGELLRAAQASARTAAVAAELDEVGTRLTGPLRLAIAGKVKAGKSTLLNAILSEDLAPTDAGECTQIVTWYVHGQQPQVLLYPLEGASEQRPFRRDGALDIDLGVRSAAEVDHLEVHWPTSRLRDLTLVDTPGIASISVDVSARTYRALTTDDESPSTVDAVLYLMRHTHSSDVRFLESFHDDEVARGTPMNTVGVLSRADEIGACRLDALDVAGRVADRYQADARLHRLCPVVLPVAGLLGYAGSTLREAEYSMLARLASLESAELTELLLTADRFGGRPVDIGVTELERQHLLGRLGLFGVRLSITLIASGDAPDATTLASELVARSGLDQLRAVLHRQFTERSRILKARSALAALQSIVDADGCTGADSLQSRAEQIVASAHEFEEVRLLNALRAGELPMSAERVTDLETLLGGRGHDAASRLGLPAETDPVEMRAAAQVVLERWQRIAEHPISSRAVQVAARSATRTVEGLLAQGVLAREIDGGAD